MAPCVGKGGLKVKVCLRLPEPESRVAAIQGAGERAAVARTELSPCPTFAVVVAVTVTRRRWWGGLECLSSVLKSCTRYVPPQPSSSRCRARKSAVRGARGSTPLFPAICRPTYSDTQVVGCPN